MRRSTLAVAALLVSLPAWAGSFAKPPGEYGQRINQALAAVGEPLRLEAPRCTVATASVCRYAAGPVTVDVSGPTLQPATDIIAIRAGFRKGEAVDGAQAFRDTLTILGATVMAYDPSLEPELRSGIIATLGEAAFTEGKGRMETPAASYTVAFDDLSGRLEITVMPTDLERP